MLTDVCLLAVCLRGSGLTAPARYAAGERPVLTAEAGNGRYGRVDSMVDLPRDVVLHVLSSLADDYQKTKSKLSELKAELKAKETAIEHMWKQFDICPWCRGKKSYFQRSCAEDEGSVRPCVYCDGSGRFPKDRMTEWLKSRMLEP